MLSSTEADLLSFIPDDLVLPIFFAVILVLFFPGVIILLRYIRKRERRKIGEVVETFGMTPIKDNSQLEELAAVFTEIFSEISMFTQELRIFSAYKTEIRGFSVQLAHIVCGVDRGNSTVTFDKVVVATSGFKQQLPRFSLLPGVRKKEFFSDEDIAFPGETFGKTNRVAGEDEERVKRVLGKDLRLRLANNRDLSIISRGWLLAFYPHGNRIVPTDLKSFVDNSVELTEWMTGFQNPGGSEK